VEKGLEAAEDKEALTGVSICKSTDTRIEETRTIYMKTAPKTAPATAPPSSGSSVEPMTVWLLLCELQY
jgi:hypothetical protein